METIYKVQDPLPYGVHLGMGASRDLLGRYGYEDMADVVE